MRLAERLINEVTNSFLKDMQRIALKYEARLVSKYDYVTFICSLETDAAKLAADLAEQGYHPDRTGKLVQVYEGY